MKRSLVIFSFCFLFFCCSKKEDGAPPAPVQYNVTVTASEQAEESTMKIVACLSLKPLPIEQ